MIQNTDPANADSLSSRSQPEILNGTAGAVQIRLAYRGTTQHVRPAAPTAACHAQIDRRFFDAFQLQASIERAPGAFIQGRGFGIGCLEQTFHRAFRRTIADDHKIPRLHEPNRAGMVRRRQQAQQHLIRNRDREKIPTHVATLKDYSIHGIPFGSGKSTGAPSHDFSPSTCDRSPENGCGPSSPDATLPKHTGHKQSWYRAAIQSICRSVIPSVQHQHWYPTHWNACPQCSHVF